MRIDSKNGPGGRRPRWGWLAGFLAIVCLALTARADGTLADLDRDNGLPDAQLGASLRNFQGMNKTEDIGRFLTFTRPADKLRFEGAEIGGITYNFFKEELYSINIDVSGAGNVRKILRLLEKKYGRGYTTDTRTFEKTAVELEIREWAGKRAYCLYKSATDGRGAVLLFVNRPKWDELEVPRRERENHARDMLKGSFTHGDF